MGIIGRHSFELCSRPRIISSASYVGDKEGKGPVENALIKFAATIPLGLTLGSRRKAECSKARFAWLLQK